MFLCLMIPTTVVLLVGVLIFSTLRLHGEAADLRRRLVDDVPGRWEKRVEVHAGRFATWMARRALGFVDVPKEARRAVQGLKWAEVGVYESAHKKAPSSVDMLHSSDHAMEGRGWDRIVTVMEKDQFVAIYVPRDEDRPSRARVAVVVAQGPQLVLACGAGDLEPIGDLVQERVPWKREGVGGWVSR